VSLGLPSLGLNREYSIYSGMSENYLEFLIREVEGGTLTPRLKSLKKGEPVDVNGPFGQFQIKESEQKRPHLLIATGTGIAPFHSFALSYPDLNYRILHGVQTSSEMYDSSSYPADRYFPCLSLEKSHYFSGRVTNYLLEAEIPDKVLVYLCGNRKMIEEGFEILRKRKVPSDAIFVEAFF
jgi:ferredoxin/flavodoxin---NADP+ reductase